MEILATLDQCLGLSRGAVALLDAVEKRWGRRVPAELRQALQMVRDLEEKLAAAQQEKTALKKAILDRDETIDRLEQRLLDKQRMKLHQVGPGAFVYALEHPKDAVEAGSWYCQPCLDKGQRTLLARVKRALGADQYECSACAYRIQVPNELRADVRTAGRRRSADLDDY